MGDRIGVVDLSRKLARRLGFVGMVRSLRGAWVGRRDPLQVWQAGVRSEVGFWERVLPERVVSDADYRRRVDPRAPLEDPLLKLLIARIPEETVHLLDVGAGPLTALGKTYPGKTLSITATDPLAGEFVRILREAGVEPPVAPIACRGEDLLDSFAPGTFDIAFARNALDHSIDPVLVITNMVHLVKEGRFVVLRHFRREAQRNCYRGLHQWNFDLEGRDLVLWRTRKKKIRVRGVLGSAAEMDSFEEGPWVVCVITKNRE